MIFDSMVAPPNRESNQVDKLLNQISQIRDKCQHDFRMKEPIELEESLVPEVYIVGESVNVVTATIVCVDCSESQDVRLSETCPACLGKIVIGYGYIRRRDDYYPAGRNLFYAAALGHCSMCGLKVVWNEWNQ